MNSHLSANYITVTIAFTVIGVFTPRAQADVIYENFSSGFADVGEGISGPDRASGAIEFGHPFTVPFGGATLESIELYLQWSVGNNSINVLVMSNNLDNPTNPGGEPGVVLETATITNAPNTATVVTATFSGETVLESEETYWVILSGVGDSLHTWYRVNNSVLAPMAARVPPGDWQVLDRVAHAFRVLGCLGEKEVFSTVNQLACISNNGSFNTWSAYPFIVGRGGFTFSGFEAELRVSNYPHELRVALWQGIRSSAGTCATPAELEPLESFAITLDPDVLSFVFFPFSGETALEEGRTYWISWDVGAESISWRSTIGRHDSCQATQVNGEWLVVRTDSQPRFRVFAVGDFSSDFDGDGVPDPCDDDVDNDGVPNESDKCDFTPAGLAIQPNGTARGDADGDCDVDLADHAIFQQELSGPNP